MGSDIQTTDTRRADGKPGPAQAASRAGSAVPSTEASDFHLLAEALPHMVWVCRDDGALAYLNRQGLDFLGTSRVESTYSLFDAAHVHSDDLENMSLAWKIALLTGSPLSTETRLRRADGEWRWHLIRAQAVKDSQGRVLRWMGTSTDIHDVREANECNAFLLGLSAELAAISHPQDLINRVMLRLRQRLEVERVTLAEIDEEEEEALLLHLSAGDDARLDVTGMSIEPFRELFDEARQGKVTWVRDTREDANAEALYRKWCGSEHGAILSAPLLRGGELKALLSAIDSDRREWTANDIELIRRVAEIVWPALEKARADRALAASEERVRLAQGVAQIGSWELAPQTAQMVLSQEACELFGLEQDVFGLHDQWVERIDPRDREAVQTMLRQGCTSVVTELEYRYLHPERGLRWIFSKSGVVEYEHQRRLVGVSLDVTDRRQAEEALREVNQRKDEFLAMLAHELRNPLAPIRNAAQLLRVHTSGRPELEWARSVIERQTRHLVRLVDDLLDVSRMVRGQIALQRSRIELGEVVRHAIETSQPLVKARRHKLHVEIQSDVQLDGDLTRLAQVLGNLLNNAAKYTDEGGEIWLTASQQGRDIVVSVRDSGFGIAPGLLPRVFDLFTQAERTLDRAQGGLGIGLTLVRRLVEMHGGRVEVRSEGLGKGSEFIVRLPALQAAAGNGVHAASESESAEETSAREGHLRILVVDDNVDAAESIAILLNMEGHETQTVHTAHEAFDAVSRMRPDVVLLDIGLPEMDGYEVARRLRNDNRIERMHLVAVTGYGQPEDRERAEAAGFDRHMVKPVEPDTLNEFLRSLN